MDIAGSPSDVQNRARAGDETSALLAGYAAVLEAASTAPLRRTRVRRIAVGMDRYLIEHIRVTLDALQRRYRLRAAAGLQSTAEQEDARRVSEFVASLPPPPSRFQAVLPFVLVLIAAQILLGGVVPFVLSFAFSFTGPTAAREVNISGLGAVLRDLADLKLSSVANVVDLLLHQDVLTTCLLLIIFLIAGYVVLRPWAAGAALARSLLDPSVADRRRSTPSAVLAATTSLHVRDREDRALRRVEATRPHQGRLDLVAPTLLASVGVLLAAVLAMSYAQGIVRDRYGTGGQCCDESTQGVVLFAQPAWVLVAALSLGALAAARLCWLIWEYRQDRPMSPRLLIAHSRPHLTRIASNGRRRYVLWPILIGTLTALALSAYVISDRGRPSAVVSAPHGLAPAITKARILPLHLSCDEPCELDSVTLAASDAPSDAYIAIQSETPLSRARATEDLELAANLRPQSTVRLRLTPRQADWLRTRLRPGGENYFHLEFVVSDTHGNTTTGFISAF